MHRDSKIQSTAQVCIINKTFDEVASINFVFLFFGRLNFVLSFTVMELLPVKQLDGERLITSICSLPLTLTHTLDTHSLTIISIGYFLG